LKIVVVNTYTDVAQLLRGYENDGISVQRAEGASEEEECGTRHK
jgi:hypothetical protein